MKLGGDMHKNKNKAWCVWLRVDCGFDRYKWQKIATFHDNLWSRGYAEAKRRFTEISIDKDFKLLPEGRRPSV
jgi:hypothetical protein